MDHMLLDTWKTINGMNIFYLHCIVLLGGLLWLVYVKYWEYMVIRRWRMYRMVVFDTTYSPYLGIELSIQYGLIFQIYAG